MEIEFNVSVGRGKNIINTKKNVVRRTTELYTNENKALTINLVVKQVINFHRPTINLQLGFQPSTYTLCQIPPHIGCTPNELFYSNI